jgi:hypothetical protein
MTENVKHLTRQAINAILAMFLIILPFFIDKWNMKTHYLFSFLAFTLLLRNLLLTKRKVIPIVLMILGLFFIFGYLSMAKNGKADSEKRIQELINQIEK